MHPVCLDLALCMGVFFVRSLTDCVCMVNATLAKEGLEWTLQKATATQDLEKMPAFCFH